MTLIGKNVQKIEIILDSNSLYNHIERRTALFIELILRTGATPKDLIGIKTSDFNEQKKTITLRVNKKKQITPQTHTISQQAINTAKQINFSAISIRRIQQLIKHHTNELKVPCSAKDLRRRYVEKVIAKGEDIVNKTQLTSIYQRRILSESEIKELLKNTTTQRNKLLIQLVLETGIRIKETANITAENVQGKNLRITPEQAYNGKSRAIPISAKLGIQISNFENKIGVSSRRFEQICQEISAKLSFSFNPSDLRASAISMLSKKLTQEELQYQTGLNSNTIYTHGLVQTVAKTTPTHSSTTSKKEERKDSESQNANETKYYKSRLRNGGGTDE